MDDQALGEDWPMGTTPLAEHPGEEEPRHWGGGPQRLKASADMGRGLTRPGKQGLEGDISEPPTHVLPGD